MSRDVSPGAATALEPTDGVIRALMFFEFDFSGGFVRLTNAAYDFPWNGFTWLGGQAFAAEAIQEGAGLAARGLTFQLSGVDPANVALALEQRYRGRACRIWFAPLDANGVVISEPVGPWTRRMDVMGASFGEEGKITLTTETRLADWDRRRARRYNDADQQSEYPGDLGMQYVESLASQILIWGSPSPTVPAQAPPNTAVVGSTNNSGETGTVGLGPRQNLSGEPGTVVPGPRVNHSGEVH